MNIFVINKNPKIAARELCDQHVVKMILESHQMLSMVVKELSSSEYWNSILPGAPKAHLKHPCTKWVLESRGNYKWLVSHLREMHLEYTRRYDKIHKQEGLLMIYEGQMPHLNFPKERRTKFALAMPDECKSASPVQSYRKFYNLHKFTFAKWKSGNIPEWFNPPVYDVILES